MSNRAHIQALDLLPAPQRLVAGVGHFTVVGNALRVGAEGADYVGIAGILAELGGALIEPDPAIPGEFIIGEPGLATTPPLAPESYVLRVTEQGVHATAHDAAGLYYAAQTLAQLARRFSGRLPAVEITDWPDLSIRGYSDDISRGQVSRPEDFQRILRLLGRWKLNLYTPYLEDMLLLASHPDIGEGRGRLTPDDVARLHKEAARQQVRIMPTFCLLGHCENLLRLPAYRHLAREVPCLPSSFDVRNPALRPFLQEVIRDVCALFPGEWFHAGCDEVRGLTKEEYCDHLSWLARELRGHGKRLVVYYDMFLNHYGHEAAERLAEDILFVNWNYAALSEYPGEAELARSRHGHLVMGGLSTWGRLSAGLPDAAANLRSLVAAGRSHGAAGALVSGWGDDGYENQRDANWHLIAYFAEQAWRGPDQKFGAFLPRFNRDFHGRPLRRLNRTLLALAEPELAGLKRWPLWHATPTALERLVAARPELAVAARELRTRTIRCNTDLRHAADQARREGEHLEHHRHCLRRTADMAERILLAERALHHRFGGKTVLLKRAGRHAAARLLADRDRFADLWLRHNWAEGMDVAVGWYDRLAEDYRHLHRPQQRQRGDHPVDLGDVLTETPLELSGVPAGKVLLDGCLFQLGDRPSSRPLRSGEELVLPFSRRFRMADLSLLLAAAHVPQEEIPALHVELRRKGKVLFEEDLLTRRHIPDWYAPRGNIWAGSGMCFVDPDRVGLAWEGIGFPHGGHFGVYRAHGFALPPTMPAADSLVLRVIAPPGPLAIHLLAVTRQAVRR
jgi:hypothetical protein